MARLLGNTVEQVQADRMGVARQLAEQCQVHVVLKGARTIIAAPDGSLAVNTTGNPGMASGGMGDVLTGLIAGFLTQGLTAAHACQAGVFLHGLAADILSQNAPWGYLSTEVMDAIPQAIHQVIDDPPECPIKAFYC
jgi:NAD(P)H-hydrate epimerase